MRTLRAGERTVTHEELLRALLAAFDVQTRPRPKRRR